jgi:hypothetical protein
MPRLAEHTSSFTNWRFVYPVVRWPPLMIGDSFDATLVARLDTHALLRVILL